VTQTHDNDRSREHPAIRMAGFDGMLVSFGETLSEPANRAALAFRAAVEREEWDGVEEISTSLVSAFLRFDPLHLAHTDLRDRLGDLLSDRDWYTEELPSGRRLWRVPTVFGTELAPELEQAAEAAGISIKDAVKSLTETRVRVQTIGFAPGQPYLGELPEIWNIPRQSQLNARIPEGALAVAIRQLVLFSVPTPTGWLHVGQTAMRLFQPDTDDPFLLRPGDEVRFVPTDAEKLNAMRRDPMGGADCEPIG